MTWGELKRVIEAAGVKDDDQIAYVDIGEASIRALHDSTPQDPDGLEIFVQDEADGTRTVSIS